MTPRSIAVTGATGRIGSRVAHLLAARGVPQRLIVRDERRAPDLDRATVLAFPDGYADATGMRIALSGISTLFLVSASARAERVAEHASVLDAAQAAGVGHVVYLSFLGAAETATFTYAREHWATEQHLRGTGMAFTILRDSFYHPIFPSMTGPDGVMRGPAGDGRMATVSPGDVAEVAAIVTLAPDPHAGMTYDLTGPTALSLDEAADILARTCDRSIVYRRETVAEAYASRAAFDAPPEVVEAWVTTYTAIAAGELGRVSAEVEAITGHRAQSLEHWLRRHPETYRHLLLD